MDEQKNINRNKVTTWIIALAAVYILFGFAFGMHGEIRLAKKYGTDHSTALKNPWVYIRSALFSPFWPVYISANLYHCHNAFGCPATSISDQ
ncbi:MAG TPA: hypothetical protein VEA18_01430 [Candidatus Kapabacteria bacterium]|nr:hypothetical protein [Candidatus Kapabacteria bacterium]